MIRDREPSLDPESVAIDALGFVAADAELLGRFLTVTGLRADELRAAAGSPGFFSAVLDFILAHKPTVIAFAAYAGIPPEAIGQAREVLIKRKGT